ncbi:Epoxyqueuosine reductase [Porphyromonas macacae]|uniref:Epoxyqueuosine reductase n=1 Tax=Porphyromonas macacae TaxID=28115 RepID=A0A379EAK1_9PORP|nr:tRNA epoxyqueuosine(34) reductase QueG [Porphyromonas macacae]SUB89381.1 Epoxyqueuosine reductase [Porphyromonas macacae]
MNNEKSRNKLGSDVAAQIKQRAFELGFAACGIVQANPVDKNVADRYSNWLQDGKHGSMSYLERNMELRFDPESLFPGVKSIIVVAMNYKPQTLQSPELPQIAYYAYGRDYHKVVKKQLNTLLEYIVKEIAPECNGRAFADSAPIMERYWAQQAGLGWIGKNGLLIIPRIGSYIVLGELFVDVDIPADKPLIRNFCGNCMACLEACPTKALYAPGIIDARKCISYMTIEAKGEIPRELSSALGNRLYGCDACQQCCPHNRKTSATTVTDFLPKPELFGLSIEAILAMDEEEFDRISAGSPIRRAGLDALKKTAQIVKDNQNNKS